MKVDASLLTLLEKYSVNGPRYTSYPTALQFHSSYTEANYRLHVERSNQYLLPKSLSLYVHIPFCQSLCYYCGCHKFITHDKERVNNYLDSLQQEIRVQASLFAKDRILKQIHFGGGTPTYLDPYQLSILLKTIEEHFTLAKEVEVSVEVDPRTTEKEDIITLKSVGFNRMSFGVQDFDKSVQKAINRVQDNQRIIDLIKTARASQVKSVSLDLIYGLPKQTVGSFKRTLLDVMAIRPNRISLYHYAHMPNKIKSQRLIEESTLPTTDEKLAMFTLSVSELTSAGYIHIGMDHFALPTDALNSSLRKGTLHRNFQGYSTHGDCDLIGVGVSAISRINDSYSQNEKELKPYQEKIQRLGLAIAKGCSLSIDDEIRAAVIQKIMCQRHVIFKDFRHQFRINFIAYFGKELIALQDLVSDGLLVMDEYGFEVTEQGVLMLRNIAMVFDRYLTSDEQVLKFSKVL